MKSNRILWKSLGLALLAAAACVSTGLAQGVLAPAAAPAPTMKTLAQIYSAVVEADPRMPLSLSTTPGVSNYLYAVTNSGSYYLTGNTQVTNGGVLVLADDVTIDLNGFTLEGDPASAYHGIWFPGRNNIVIRNGAVMRFGDSGVYSGYLDDGVGFVAEDIRVMQNSQYGLLVSAYASSISCCTAISNGQYGIYSSKDTLLEDSISKWNTYKGIYIGSGSTLTGNICSDNGWEGIETAGLCLIQGNTVRNNGYAGIDADEYSLVKNNTVTGNGNSGISVAQGSRVRDNTVAGNNTNLNSISGGIFMQTGSHASGNTLFTNNVQGIYVWSSDCVVEDNAISGSLTGITFKVSGSLYVDNRFSGLGTDVAGTATDGGGNVSF